MTKTDHHTRIEKLLLEAARIFNSTLDYEELITSVLRLVMTAVQAEAALVFRVDHEREDVKIRFLKQDDAKMRVFNRHIGQGIFGWVAQFQEPAVVNEPHQDARCDEEVERVGEIRIRSLLAVPLIGKGQMIGVIEAINSRNGTFSDDDLDILTGLNNQIAVAIDNAHLYRELKREALEKHLLYEIGKKLSSTLRLDQLLHDILESLQKVVPFSAGGVFLIDPEEGSIKSISTVGYPPEVEDRLQLKIGQGLIGYVAKSGEPVIVPRVSEDQRYVVANEATRSEMVVPIQLDERMIAVINLESEQEAAYDERTLSLVTAFASQAAVSLERARLHQTLIEGQALKEQLRIAREIQRTFLPKNDPRIDGYDITGVNISSGDVGGDYYDFISIVDRHIGVAIGDVAGKGIPAALIMASFRASLLAEIRNNYSIRAICRKVNALLCESTEPENFVTAVYAVLDANDHVLTFANCGHSSPILLRADGKVEFLNAGGPLMGVIHDAVYDERALVLQPGDVVLMYTDGASEVFDVDGNEFGAEGLIQVLKEYRDRPATEIRQAIHRAAIAYAAPDHAFDDITMIVIKRLAEETG